MTVDFNKLCYGCFKEKDTPICPSCGFNSAAPDSVALALPPGSILNGCFMVGKVLSQDAYGFAYLGIDLTKEQKVTIHELAPAALIARGSDAISIMLLSNEAAQGFLAARDTFFATAQAQPSLAQFKENNTDYYVTEFLEQAVPEAAPVPAPEAAFGAAGFATAEPVVAAVAAETLAEPVPFAAPGAAPVPVPAPEPVSTPYGAPAPLPEQTPYGAPAPTPYGAPTAAPAFGSTPTPMPTPVAPFAQGSSPYSAAQIGGQPVPAYASAPKKSKTGMIIGIIVGVLVLVAVVVGVVIGMNSCSNTPAPAPTPSPTQGLTPTPSPDPSPTPSPDPSPSGGTLSAEALDFWDGGWYGWWQWTNTTGDAKDNEGGWWDCLAEVTMNSDGTSGHIVIWDGDWGKDDGIAEVDFTLSANGGNLGTMTSTSGWFINKNVYVNQGEWVIVEESKYSNMIRITGHFQHATDSSTSFDYSIILRPWGATWDDVPESWLPGHYEDWYLPKIASNSPLPTTLPSNS